MLSTKPASGFFNSHPLLQDGLSWKGIRSQSPTENLETLMQRTLPQNVPDSVCCIMGRRREMARPNCELTIVVSHPDKAIFAVGDREIHLHYTFHHFRFKGVPQLLHIPAKRVGIHKISYSAGWTCQVLKKLYVIDICTLNVMCLYIYSQD